MFSLFMNNESNYWRIAKVDRRISQSVD